MPRKSSKCTTLLLKSGRVPATVDELFERVFWKSITLATEAKIFFLKLIEMEPDGFPVSRWKEWTERRKLSTGSFYNMLHGLEGAGFIEKREGAWHVSRGFLRELEQMVILYTSLTGYEHRLK
ncbi:hypothetical protein B6U74_02005 [Candidatus Bathyarchaeota archaeon ex4484_205]|nr:MAG: hypothetical protein B6U74_02005 [Candidatus Bathyarchaeota archaeon ex4484_205]RLG68905.1 MAG: hypothetical protein DRN93_01605 [archaeon]HDN17656.1 hypothetical protein [Candidatus Bathyarchaeota archaeon]